MYKNVNEWWSDWWGFIVLMLGLLTLSIVVNVGSKHAEEKERDQIYQFLRDDGWSGPQAEAWTYKNKLCYPKCMIDGYLEKYIEWCDDKELEWK